MPWSRPKSVDPLLTSQHWRVTIRGHWKRLRLPCAVCGRAIAYDAPRYLIIDGRKRINPRSLVVGHIVSRYEAKRRGWTEQQSNALGNTRPECFACSNRSGAMLGQRVRAAQNAGTTSTYARPATASRW